MATVSERPAGRNGNRKLTTDIIKQLKEMTNAADEDIQMALQECNGDVNRAAMSIIDNPFQEVRNKKVKPKPTEKPSYKPPQRDSIYRDRKDYHTSSERYDRTERSERADRGGRGRDDTRGGRAGGRASGRGRGFREGDAQQPLGPTTKQGPTVSASQESDAVPVATTSSQWETPSVPMPVATSTAAPASPPKAPAPVPSTSGSTWASKLKPTAAVPAAQPTVPEAAPAEPDTYSEPADTEGWGLAPAQEIEQPVAHDTGADDAFGNGFSHRGDVEAASASWGPPAPGDAAAQWGSPQDLPKAALDDVAKPFDTGPTVVPAPVPTTSSPSFTNQHQSQGNFDFSSMASTLQPSAYGADVKYGTFNNLRKDNAQSSSSIPFPQSSVPQQGDYSTAFSNVFHPQPSDVTAAASDDRKTAANMYIPPGVPGFAQFTQPQPYQAPYGNRDRKQQPSMTDAFPGPSDKDPGYSLPNHEKGPTAHDQRATDEPQQNVMQPQQPLQQMQPQDMQFSMQMPSPDTQMYSQQQQQQQQQPQQPPRPGATPQQGPTQVMSAQPGLGIQQPQPQSQAQMANFMPQQAGVPAYGNYGNPSMAYSAMPGFPAANPNLAYAGMQGYGMGFPPAAYPQYAFHQGQNFAAQQPPAPYASAQAAYGAKPAYDGTYPQAGGGTGGGRGGSSGGRRNKNKGFGRGGVAQQAHNQGMASLPNEPFNSGATQAGTYNYGMDPAWNSRGFEYKQDKNMPAQQQQQYDSYGMQQGFQPVSYGGTTFSGQQYTTQAQYSNQWGGSQDKSGYPKYS